MRRGISVERRAKRAGAAVFLYVCSGLAAAAAWSIAPVGVSNGLVNLAVTGDTGAVCAVQVSTNLVGWRTLQVVTNATGTFDSQDSAGPQAQRFYRVAAPALPLDSWAGAESYCLRAGVVSPNARRDIHRFVDGVASLGLLSHLADFAFFAEGQNVPQGNPVSWRNTGGVVGSVNRLPGGYEFQNSNIPAGGPTNHLWFTNLPPTADGRTLIFWGAGNMNPTVISQDANLCLAELTSAGAGLTTLIDSILCLNGAYGGYVFDGNSQYAQSGGSYGPSGSENDFFMAYIASQPGSSEIGMSTGAHGLAAFSLAQGADISPAVFRFAYRMTGQPATASWNGLIRGFAYFDLVLSSNQCLQVDQLVPRIGVVAEGDSKTVPFIVPWVAWWLNTPPAWGLYSLLTNSAVAGTGTADALARWPDNAVFRTNAQLPIIIYTAREGHNDLGHPGSELEVANAAQNLSNLWFFARTNGDRVLAWTVDRTVSTWAYPGDNPGNSNLLEELNANIRSNSAQYDFLVDAESWYVSNYGPTPYTNHSIYNDGLHESALGARLLATNCVGAVAVPTLGYERE